MATSIPMGTHTLVLSHEQPAPSGSVPRQVDIYACRACPHLDWVDGVDTDCDGLVDNPVNLSVAVASWRGSTAGQPASSAILTLSGLSNPTTPVAADGDGFLNLLCARRGWFPDGKAYLLRGPLTGASSAPSDAWGSFDWVGTSQGDLDLDGASDLMNQ